MKRVRESWPPRPEVFPELLDTVDLAMLLRYDASDNSTPDKGARMIRLLVRDAGLPVAGRVGRKLLFKKSQALEWLGSRGSRQCP